MTSLSDMETLAHARARLFAGYLSMAGRRWWTHVSVALFAAYGLLMVLLPFQHPAWNWDMLAYLAVVQEDRVSDAASLHSLVYGQMREAAPAGDYLDLTAANEYRAHQAGNPEAFATMLPMYRVKLLYVETLRLLAPVTGPVEAMRWINSISVIALFAFLAAWMGRRGLAMAAPAAAILGLSGFAGFVQLGTPDLMSAALLTGGLWLHFTRREAGAAALLALAFLTRPDTIVFLAVAMAVSIVLKERAWGLATAFIVALLSYGPLTAAAGHQGWWPHFWFSVVNYELTLQDFNPVFSFIVYLKAVVLGLARSVIEGGWPLLVALAAGGAVLLSRCGAEWTRREGAMAAAAVLAILAKFVIFPVHDGRLYFPLSFIPLLVLLVVLQRFLDQGQKEIHE